MNRRFATAAIVTMLLGVLSGCASTRLASTWHEPAYQNKIEKILILGMAKNESIKRSYESTLSQAIRDAGAQADSAGSVLPSGADTSSEEAIRAAIKGKGYDTVLVTRLVSKDSETRYVPGTPYPPPRPYYNGFHDYYMNVYPTVYSPGYMVNDTIVNLETNIYELKDGKLVWAVMSESFNPDDVNKAVKELSKMLVKQLKKDGFL